MIVVNKNYMKPIEIKMSGVEKEKEQEILLRYIRTALRIVKKSRDEDICYKIEID